MLEISEAMGMTRAELLDALPSSELTDRFALWKIRQDEQAAYIRQLIGQGGQAR